MTNCRDIGGARLRTCVQVILQINFEQYEFIGKSYSPSTFSALYRLTSPFLLPNKAPWRNSGAMVAHHRKKA